MERVALVCNCCLLALEALSLSSDTVSGAVTVRVSLSLTWLGFSWLSQSAGLACAQAVVVPWPESAAVTEDEQVKESERYFKRMNVRNESTLPRTGRRRSELYTAIV